MTTKTDQIETTADALLAATVALRQAEAVKGDLRDQLVGASPWPQGNSLARPLGTVTFKDGCSVSGGLDRDAITERDALACSVLEDVAREHPGAAEAVRSVIVLLVAPLPEKTTSRRATVDARPVVAPTAKRAVARRAA